MGRRLLCVCLLVCATVSEVSGLKIRNKLLGKCLQAHGGTAAGRVSLGECSPSSPSQQWRWLPGGRALSNQHTGECLSAPGGQDGGVYLQPCIYKAGDGAAAAASDRESSSQTWSCSRKGHLTLMGQRLHLSATQQSTLPILSQEHTQGSRWQSLDTKTLCHGRDSKHSQPHPSLGNPVEPEVSPSAISDEHKQAEQFEHIMSMEITETYPVMNQTLSSMNIKSSADPTMIFFSMDYGMGWKITMLVLSSLGLVLGTAILILNVYSNRRKKVVCVLKSYKPRPETSVAGSPAPSERAPLTEHAMRPPRSSPTAQRGEILIEWKDGSVTPLYEA
ncbi:uncharacterized protein si:dkey-245n4.2 [Betta splendens]|uniref:Uncharacterized protein si:dkey-245n4.2 n=1 Tax=Betta splendens TaxID=158456 RepID=A0A6P7NQT5_BETSP|nr:uncharacterized protein si:dkey-245n4.2 [Betta splendens]